MKLDLDSLALTLDSLELVRTEKATGKVVRQNSDDLRRAGDLVSGLRRGAADCTVAFSEIPTAGQSARAATSFGIVIGALAGLALPVIQVMPNETKLASVGRKTASKAEMIAWATGLHPHAGWLRDRGKKDGRLLADNEHLADAVAVVHAGIQTADFKRLAAFLRKAA